MKTLILFIVNTEFNGLDKSIEAVKMKITRYLGTRLVEEDSVAANVLPLNDALSEGDKDVIVDIVEPFNNAIYGTLFVEITEECFKNLTGRSDTLIPLMQF